MTQYEPTSPALQRFWHLLLDAPPPPSREAMPIHAPVDAEFDFLAEPAPASKTMAGDDGWQPDPVRIAQLAELEAMLPEVAHALGQALHAIAQDSRLDRVDAAGALWVCRVLLLLPGATLPEHGPLVRLLQRAARSVDPELVVLAADAIRHLDARGAQLDLVARLHANPSSLGHDGVDHVLACLGQVADGRCVREMEALLVERGAELSDVHAWQARHIVQVIRRSGRK